MSDHRPALMYMCFVHDCFVAKDEKCSRCEADRASRDTQVAAVGFQHYWSCEHYPQCIKNFFDGRTFCEWGCHAQPLQWWHGGRHPKPKSDGWNDAWNQPR